ncbi:MAG: radical SAM protein [Methanobacteriota archaeon]
MTEEKFFRTYYVWPRFPSVSISGSVCALDCLHCGKEYLKFMTPAATPAALEEVGRRLVNDKAGEGMLISGGCDKKGRMLNLPKFLPALEKLHDMGLIIKLHTGLVDEKLARGIAEAGVDITSMEFVGSRESAREIFGINAGPEDYAETFAHLRDAGVPHIAPHVAVGLHRGELLGEFEALDSLRKTVEPSTIALIAFRPTKGTKLECCKPPSAEAMERVASHARKLFPETKIILGALRPRGTGAESGKAVREGLEMAALRGGISGAEVPSAAMLAEIRAMEYKIKRIEAFGVLPEEYEERVKWKWE